MVKEKEQTTLRLPAELKEFIQNIASKRGISENALMIVILQEYLQRLDR